MCADRVILLHHDAPAQPPAGAPCNGCGLCCAAEPCPVGIVASLRWRGRCRLLRWDEAQTRYRCGAMTDGRGWPARAARRLMSRWIAAGIGCDSALRADSAGG